MHAQTLSDLGPRVVEGSFVFRWPCFDSEFWIPIMGFMGYLSMLPNGIFTFLEKILYHDLKSA